MGKAITRACIDIDADDVWALSTEGRHGKASDRECTSAPQSWTGDGIMHPSPFVCSSYHSYFFHVTHDGTLSIVHNHPSMISYVFDKGESRRNATLIVVQHRSYSRVRVTAFSPLFRIPST